MEVRGGERGGENRLQTVVERTGGTKVGPAAMGFT